MSSFGDSMGSKGIRTKFQKFGVNKGNKPKAAGTTKTMLLNDTDSVSSSSGNEDSNRLHSDSPTRIRRSLPESEMDTKRNKVNMSLKKLRQQFSVVTKLNSLDVRRQTLLEHQDELVGEVLAETKEEKQSKKKSKTVSSLEAANTPMDGSTTQPPELSSTKSKKKKKNAGESSVEISHDEYGESEQPSGEGEASKTKRKKKKKKKASKSAVEISHDEYGDVEQSPDNLEAPIGSEKKKKKKKKKTKSDLEISHDEYGDLEHSPDNQEVPIGSEKKKKKKAKTKSDLAVVEGGNLDQAAEEASGEKTSKKKKKKKKKKLLSEDAHDTSEEGLDSSPRGTKKKKTTVKKKKPKKKSEFTASLLDDLELELGDVAAEEAAKIDAEDHQDERSMDASGTAPEMDHELDNANNGTMDESCDRVELNETMIEDEPNQPKAQRAQSPSEELEAIGNAAETTEVIVESAIGSMVDTVKEEGIENDHTAHGKGPDQSQEASPQTAENGAENSEVPNQEASLDVEETNSATEMPIVNRSASPMPETNAHALSPTDETSDADADSDSDCDEDGDSTNMGKDLGLSSVELESEGAETNTPPITVASRDQATSEMSTVYEVVGDTGSDCSHAGADAEQEEPQVQFAPIVEELVGDVNVVDVDQAEENKQFEPAPTIEELGEDSNSDFSDSDFDSDSDSEVEEEDLEEETGMPVFRRSSSLKSETNLFALNLMYGTSDSDSDCYDSDDDTEIGESFLDPSRRTCSSYQVDVNGNDIPPPSEEAVVADDSAASDAVIIQDEGQSPAALRKQVEELQKQLDQQRQKTKTLEESVATHESKSIEQSDQIAMYKGMFEDLKEDYDMVMEKYNEQVEQNALQLGLVGRMKHETLACERVIKEQVNRIQVLEQQISMFQQPEQSHMLAALEAENEKLQGMVDLQKKSLFKALTQSRMETYRRQ